MAGHVIVTGASGKIGSKLAETLLERGVKVKVVGRSEERLSGLSAKGADPVAADLHDESALLRAFSGATGVFAMVPPDYAAEDMLDRQARVVDALAGALGKAGAPPTVALSSGGADRPSGTGPIVTLHRFEKTLSAVPGLPLVILRPAYFMENHLGSLAVIKAHGILGGTVAPDRPFSQIATRDIAAFAADLLAVPSFTGRSTRPLLGPRDVSLAGAAAILGRSIGRPDLPYVRLEESALRQGLIDAGFARAVAGLFIEMNKALGQGLIDQPRTPESTTPTTLEMFAADTFAPAFRG